MLDTSKDLLYIAIAIGVISISAGLTYVLIRVGKLVLDTQSTVKDVNRKLAKFDEAVDQAAPALGEMAESMREINKNLIRPMGQAGNFIRKILGMFNPLK